MACDTRLKPRQTISQRATEVRLATERLAAALAAGRVRVAIDKTTGAIAFQNWDETSRDGITDACAYRRIMSTGSALARMAIAKAEAMAGRTVNKQAVGQGVHSHDGGTTWHSHKS
jgi:hypothetical protein